MAEQGPIDSSHGPSLIELIEDVKRDRQSFGDATFERNELDPATTLDAPEDATSVADLWEEPAAEPATHTEAPQVPRDSYVPQPPVEDHIPPAPDMTRMPRYGAQAQQQRGPAPAPADVRRAHEPAPEDEPVPVPQSVLVRIPDPVLTERYPAPHSGYDRHTKILHAPRHLVEEAVATLDAEQQERHELHRTIEQANKQYELEKRAEAAQLAEKYSTNPLEREFLEEEGAREKHPVIDMMDSIYANNIISHLESMLHGHGVTKEDIQHTIQHVANREGVLEVYDELYKQRFSTPEDRAAYMQHVLLPLTYEAIRVDYHVRASENQTTSREEAQPRKKIRLRNMFKSNDTPELLPSPFDKERTQLETTIQRERDSHLTATDTLRAILVKLDYESITDLYYGLENEYPEGGINADGTPYTLEAFERRSFLELIDFLDADPALAQKVESMEGKARDQFVLKGYLHDPTEIGVEPPAPDNVDKLYEAFGQRWFNIGSADEMRDAGTIVANPGDKPLVGGFVVQVDLDEVKLHTRPGTRKVRVVQRRITERAMNTALDGLVSKYAPQGVAPQQRWVGDYPTMMYIYTQRVSQPRLRAIQESDNTLWLSSRYEQPKRDWTALVGPPPTGQAELDAIAEEERKQALESSHLAGAIEAGTVVEEN